MRPASGFLRDEKVPHVGWNSLDGRATNSRLLRGVESGSFVYYTHSYRAPVIHDTVAVTEYGEPFTAAVERDNVMGVQFHPEKSGPAGLQILRNFVELWMLTKRIIACLDVTGGRVVKGVQFVDLVDAGDPAELAARHAEAGADEIVLLDITATHEGRGTLLETVRRTAQRLFIPFTVGGGVRTLDDAAAVFDAGADKVSVNSAALRRPELIDEIGAQLWSAGGDRGHRCARRCGWTAPRFLSRAAASRQGARCSSGRGRRSSAVRARFC